MMLEHAYHRGIVIFVSAILIAGVGYCQNGGLEVHLEVVADGFVSPLGMAQAGDGSGRLFVVDQLGEVWVVDGGVRMETPFLDVSDLMVDVNPNYDERGLLGLAFHPDYSENGRFFVYYSAPTTTPGMNHKTVLAEYTVSPGDPNRASETGTALLEVEQPESNHNGGQLAFGPDGYLYLGLGDGGGAGDQHGEIGNGQDTEDILGSIIRLDVSASGQYAVPPDNPLVGQAGDDRIWAYGLRNPWRFSFDRGGDRDLFAADVGQNEYEEVDIIRKGENYGWRIMEGFHCYNPSTGCDQTGLTLPIAEYDHSVGVSITGGYVYRGSAIPELVGKYVFGDWNAVGSEINGLLLYLEETGPENWELREFLLKGGPGSGISDYLLSFGEDEEGELYLLTQANAGPRGTTGKLQKIVPPPTATPTVAPTPPATETPTPPPTSTTTPTQTPAPTTPPTPPSLLGDLNDDEVVDEKDLLLMLNRWRAMAQEGAGG